MIDTLRNLLDCLYRPLHRICSIDWISIRPTVKFLVGVLNLYSSGVHLFSRCVVCFFFPPPHISLALVFIHCRHSNASFRSSRRKLIENKGREEDIRNINIGGVSLERNLELNDERSIKTHLSSYNFVTAINAIMKLRRTYARNTLVYRHNIWNKLLCVLSVVIIPVQHPWPHNFIQCSMFRS